MINDNHNNINDSIFDKYYSRISTNSDNSI